jgi:hypothetical protein
MLQILLLFSEFRIIYDKLEIVNGLNYRFSSDMGHFKSNDFGDQREASELRDEVCQLH